MKLPDTDMDYISGLKSGSEKALDVVFNQFYQPLVYFAIRIIKDREEAEDIVVSTFSKLWDRKENLDNLPKVKGFLYLTTRNACIDFLRKTKKNNELQKDLLYLIKPEAGDDFEEIRAELLGDIFKEIEKLPSLCRQVFELSVFKGLKSKEISERMHISVSNVTSQKSRAVQLLKTTILKKILSILLLFLLTKQ
jgi:RNA polymerase sigma-70 factor (family 1)